MKKIVVAVVCVVLVVFVFTYFGSGQAQKELPRDIKWVAHSIEYFAICEQTYRAAWPVVQKAAEGEPQNWVVVLDVDETVLDNSLYAVERAAVDSGYSRYSWNDWVERKIATLVPGAKPFIDKVRTLPNAHIAYITNRMHYNETATIENLQKYDLFKPGDTMLTKIDRDDTKEMRRAALESGTGRCEKNGPLVILAFFGDNIRDFIPMKGTEKAIHYRNQEIAQDERWGQTFFMLPNPTYGSWESDYN